VRVCWPDPAAYQKTLVAAGIGCCIVAAADERIAVTANVVVVAAAAVSIVVVAAAAAAEVRTAAGIAAAVEDDTRIAAAAAQPCHVQQSRHAALSESNFEIIYKQLYYDDKGYLFWFIPASHHPSHPEPGATSWRFHAQLGRPVGVLLPRREMLLLLLLL
jgi:hypothetical protein